MKTEWKKMRPEEFLEARENLPVAYLPLGTLEWHGKHMPLGSDGLQSEALFLEVAKRIGGLVLPMLFLGPDRSIYTENEEYHGMDIYRENRLINYPTQKMPGSIYWADDDLFNQIFKRIVANLARQEIKVLVAYGHGPSNKRVRALREELEKQYSMKIVMPTDYITGEYAYMADHAASSETSIIWATHEDLLDMSKLASIEDCVGIIGRNPIEFASKEYGEKMVELNTERLCDEILKLVKE